MYANVNKDNLNMVDWQSVSNLRIAVVGDIILDKYISGACNRVSPEAPVLVLNKSAEHFQIGGAGNVVNNLVGLGVKASIFSVIGDDEAGMKIKRLLDDLDVSTEMLIVDDERVTTEKTRLLAQNQQILRIDTEIITKINVDIEKRIINKIKKNILSYDAIIISDYQKGVCSPTLIQTLISIGLKQQLPIFVDSKMKDYSIFKDATCITPNVHEASKALGYEITNDEEASEAACHLSKQFNIPNVLITRGADGMTLYRRGVTSHFPIIAKQVFDVSGAGDTVIATLTTLIILGLNWEEAIRVTNVAAGIVVAKLGTMPVMKDELIYELYNMKDSLFPSSKILSDSTLNVLLDKWRTEGKKIVFTNGCFDILHEGHIELLEKAKRMGDVLIIGLNSDLSVKRLKGESRPINNQSFRARLLSSMYIIDAVVIFDQDTPRDIIEFIKPDVLVKGADYSVNEVVGRDILHSYGGKVMLIPFIDGLSTTEIIDRIKNIIPMKIEG